MNDIDIKHTCSFTGHKPERLIGFVTSITLSKRPTLTNKPGKHHLSYTVAITKTSLPLQSSIHSCIATYSSASL